MSTQPRDEHSGRWAAKINSAPESALCIAEPAPPGETMQTLLNITGTFRALARIRNQGQAAFHAEGSFLPLASVGALVRLGEQASHLGEDFVSRNPGPSYHRAIATRHVMAHRFDVDWQIVWRTIDVFVPHSFEAHQQVQAKFASRSGYPFGI